MVRTHNLHTLTGTYKKKKVEFFFFRLYNYIQGVEYLHQNFYLNVLAVGIAAVSLFINRGKPYTRKNFAKMRPWAQKPHAFGLDMTISCKTMMMSRKGHHEPRNPITKDSKKGGKLNININWIWIMTMTTIIISSPFFNFSSVSY
jgi:hypothetical protein